MQSQVNWDQQVCTQEIIKNVYVVQPFELDPIGATHGPQWEGQAFIGCNLAVQADLGKSCWLTSTNRPIHAIYTCRLESTLGIVSRVQGFRMNSMCFYIGAQTLLPDMFHPAETHQSSMQCSSSYAGPRDSSGSWWTSAWGHAPSSWLFLLFSRRLLLGDLGASPSSPLGTTFSLRSSLSEAPRAARMYRTFASVSSTWMSFDLTDQSILMVISLNCTPQRDVNSGRFTSTSLDIKKRSSSRAFRNWGMASSSFTAASMCWRSRAVHASFPYSVHARSEAYLQNIASQKKNYMWHPNVFYNPTRSQCVWDWVALLPCVRPPDHVEVMRFALRVSVHALASHQQTQGRIWLGQGYEGPAIMLLGLRKPPALVNRDPVHSRDVDGARAPVISDFQAILLALAIDIASSCHCTCRQDRLQHRLGLCIIWPTCDAFSLM